MSTDTTQPAGAQSPSDTPRTDALGEPYGTEISAGDYEGVLYLCHTLERELATANARIAELEQIVGAQSGALARGDRIVKI